MFILINKPKGITSHDVIDKLRKMTGVKKIGHAGTLDPNATGLLIVGIGRESTRKLGDLSKNTNKTYIATIILGEEKDTDDSEGNTIKEYDVSSPPHLGEIKRTLKKFTGKQQQTPPAFSAIKIKGQKSYNLARAGKPVTIKPRTITVYEAKLLNYKFPVLEVQFEVTSGTYIRSLAKDIGKSLNVGGYLGDLQRTSIANFSLNDAHSLEELTSDNWENYTISI